MPTQCLISKAKLASLLEVAPPQVSKWVKREQLYGAALIGSGRAQLVDLDHALQQLQHLDPGQSFGHGSNRSDAVDRLIERRRTGWDPNAPAKEISPPVLRQFASDPIALGGAAMAVYFVNHLGQAISSVLMGIGAPIELAFKMENLSTMVAFELAEEGADEIGGFDLRDQPLVDMDNMARTNWPALAKKRGIVFDERACRDYAQVPAATPVPAPTKRKKAAALAE